MGGIRENSGSAAFWALAIVGLVGIAGLALWWTVTRGERGPQAGAPPQLQGSLSLAGPEAPLRIDRNRHGVPQVQAASERDAWFGLGFSHAQDRLGQLLRLRLRAQGRSAERLGAAALDADRVARLIDFAGLADRQWSRLPEPARQTLEAYAAGVEAGIVRIREGAEAPPAGFEAAELESWRPQDSLALFKLFAWNLGASIELSLVLQELLAELGAGDAARFFPPRLAGGAGPGRAVGVASWLGSGLRELRRAGGLDGHGVGSTAFVLGGAHSEGGLPLLVADSHATPTQPAAFHLAHLRAPGLDVAGLTLPGVPVFWSGRNARLAWACVHTGAVVTDLYVETLRRDATEYHDGRSWQTVETRPHTLRVRGGAAEEFSARRTSRGPLLPLEREGGEAIAVSWTGARIDGPSGIASLLAISRASGGEALRAALAEHREPVVAVVWADVEGAAGLQMAGWVPRRSLASQLLPLPGRASWYHWAERVAYEDLPTRILDEGQGFLVAADQRLQNQADAVAIDTVWRPGLRAARLTRRLAALTSQGPDLRSAMALQTDPALPRSLEVVELALELVGSHPHGQEARELAQLLEAWDGEATPESAGAAAYHAFLDRLGRALFSEPLGGLFERYLEVPQVDVEGLVHGVLLDAAAGEGDRWSGAERVKGALVESLRETWLALAFRLGGDPRRWQWGELHPLHFAGPEGTGGIGPFFYGGAPHALLAAGYSAAEPFAVQVAATARLGVDLAAPDLLLAALAPGQAEHPGRPSHAGGVEAWLRGRYALLATRRVEIDEHSVARLDLEPLH